MRFNVIIVGRANVGKSTLSNALLGYGRSIIYDEPGTTLDRVMEPTDWGKGELHLFDNPGVLGDDAAHLSSSELIEASVIVWVVDATSGVTPLDREIAKQFRRVKKPILLVVNKSDARSAEGSSHFAELGVKDMIECSAVHRRGTQAIREWILQFQCEMPHSGAILRLAILGRPNTGKSTLLNRLSRSRVSRVSPEALTTRDPVAFDIPFKGHVIRVIDTAGMRRPRSEKHPIEELSIESTIKVLERSQVVFLCLAADEGVTDQDRRLLSLIDRKQKPAVILFNFWDRLSRHEQRVLWEDRPSEFSRFEMLPISAKTGYNLTRLLPLTVTLSKRSQERVPTSKVNALIRKIVDRNPPPTRGGKSFNILYASQVRTSPPTFVFFMNRKDSLPASYRKYLENAIRCELDYQSQPMQLFFRQKYSS